MSKWIRNDKPYEGEPLSTPEGAKPTDLENLARETADEINKRAHYKLTPSGLHVADSIILAALQRAVDQRVRLYEHVRDENSKLTAQLAEKEAEAQGYFDALMRSNDLRDKLTAQLAELQGWKDSAMTVESEWNAQEVGNLLDLPLGSSIRAQIAPAIRRLQAQLADERETTERVRHAHDGQLRLRWQIENELAAAKELLREWQALRTLVDSAPLASATMVFLADNKKPVKGASHL